MISDGTDTGDESAAGVIGGRGSAGGAVLGDVEVGVGVPGADDAGGSLGAGAVGVGVPVPVCPAVLGLAVGLAA